MGGIFVSSSNLGWDFGIFPTNVSFFFAPSENPGWDFLGGIFSAGPNLGGILGFPTQGWVGFYTKSLSVPDVRVLQGLGGHINVLRSRKIFGHGGRMGVVGTRRRRVVT